jgi:hypothetical protein
MYRKLIFLLLFIEQPFLLSKPPLKLLQEFYEAKGEEEEKNYELSFLHGIVGVESGLLKNRWLYGNPEDATIQLLKSLFYVEECEEFLITTHQPYRNFTPATLLFLITNLYNKVLYIKDEHNNYTAIKELVKTFKGNKTPQRLTKLIKTIEQAEQEEQCNKYSPGTVLQILLAFLYLQSDENDFKTYITELPGLLNSQGLEQLESLDSTKIIDEIVETKKLNCGKLIIQEVINRHYLPNHPPNIQWMRKVFYKNPPPISDCCETVIRKFINELVYDDETKTFDLQNLPKELYNTVPEQIKNFYLTHRSAQTQEEINSHEVHNEWLHCVSDLPDAQYRKEGYEIHPSLNNILSIISYLCGSQQKKCLTITDSLKSFCKKLSQGTFFTINYYKISNSNDICTDVSFSIAKKTIKQPQTRCITMHIRENHAWLTQDFIDERHNVLALIHNEAYEPTEFSVVCDKLFENLLQPLTTKRLDVSTMFSPFLDLDRVSDKTLLTTLLFSHQTRTESAKYNCFKKIWSHYKKNNDPHLLRFALGLIKSFYNSHLTTYALTNLIQGDFCTTSNVKECIVSKLPSLQKENQQQCMLALCAKGLWADNDYKNCIMRILPEIDDYAYTQGLHVDNKLFTLIHILNYKADQNDSIKNCITCMVDTLTKPRAKKFAISLRLRNLGNE